MLRNDVHGSLEVLTTAAIAKPVLVRNQDKNGLSVRDNPNENASISGSTNANHACEHCGEP